MMLDCLTRRTALLVLILSDEGTISLAGLI
jgi:hypothetical protein